MSTKDSKLSKKIPNKAELPTVSAMSSFSRGLTKVLSKTLLLAMPSLDLFGLPAELVWAEAQFCKR